MSKVVKSLKEAISLAGLKDGMTISFHHHLRNGDQVLNLVLQNISDLGIKNLTVNASSIFNVHAPLIRHIKDGVVTGIETAYIGGVVGQAISDGILGKPVKFFTHGGRPALLENGSSHIDVAFVAAPSADVMGNCSGKDGMSACGSLGYAFTDIKYAKTAIVVTDNLLPYPLPDFSLCETYIDYVVVVDSIGDPSGIMSGTTQISRDPVGLKIAENTADVIQHLSYFKEGFSFQAGAGSISLAVSQKLRQIMLDHKIVGSFVMGGITKQHVEMLRDGCFKTLLDVQCFDSYAVNSLRSDVGHVEVDVSHYANPLMKSNIVDSLDVAILGAAEIDTDFNVNVHTNFNGVIMGGSGGHSDVAAGAKVTIIVAPLIRSRMGVIVDKVIVKSTPGRTIDILVTQRGIAVNPARPDIKEQLQDCNLMEIEELKHISDKITGVPNKLMATDKVVADIVYRDGSIMDKIFQG